MIRITNYFDVWGNRKEGFTVNNLFYHDYPTIDIDIYDLSVLLKTMKKIGFVRKSARIRSFIFDYSQEHKIGIYDHDMCPLFEIENMGKWYARIFDRPYCIREGVKYEI